MSEDLKILSREEILNADDRAEETVDVPEWGGAVRVKALSLGQWQDAMKAATQGGVVDDTLASLHTIIEGVIEPKFSVEDVTVLRTKSPAAVTKVIGKIAELSGVDTAAVKAAEARFPDEAGG